MVGLVWLSHVTALTHARAVFQQIDLEETSIPGAEPFIRMHGVTQVCSDELLGVVLVA